MSDHQLPLERVPRLPAHAAPPRRGPNAATLAITGGVVAALAINALTVFGVASALPGVQLLGVAGGLTAAGAPFDGPAHAPEVVEVPEAPERFGDFGGDELDDSAGPDWTNVFDEREAFFRDQQVDLSAPNIPAVTPAQRAFVEEARSLLASHGEDNWDQDMEHLVMALALNACETSILSGHDIDDFTVRFYAATSPLLAEILGEDPAERPAEGVTGFMILTAIGTKHLCPADAPQWMAGVDEVGSDW